MAGLPYSTKAKIFELHKLGETQVSIAAQLGIKPSAVNYHLAYEASRAARLPGKKVTVRLVNAIQAEYSQPIHLSRNKLALKYGITRNQAVYLLKDISWTKASTKLDENQISQIRILYQTGIFSQAKLAAKFGVSQPTIKRKLVGIKCGRNFKTLRRNTLILADAASLLSLLDLSKKYSLSQKRVKQILKASGRV